MHTSLVIIAGISEGAKFAQRKGRAIHGLLMNLDQLNPDHFSPDCGHGR
ncbi:hypothetical protein [Hahella sp. CCB-MM4]|nr:hypothetical protein [Hahella sp. CCB-MM4]